MRDNKLPVYLGSLALSLFFLSLHGNLMPNQLVERFGDAKLLQQILTGI
jgi:hypothetical protein